MEMTPKYMKIANLKLKNSKRWGKIWWKSRTNICKFGLYTKNFVILVARTKCIQNFLLP